jgi:hypothetical protein
VKERLAELLLQAQDLGADRRLGDQDAGRSAGELAFLGDRDEGAELSQIQTKRSGASPRTRGRQHRDRRRTLVGTHTGPLASHDGQSIPATGRRLRLRMTDAATIADAGVTSHRLYFDQLELLEQLGLAPDG